MRNGRSITGIQTIFVAAFASASSLWNLRIESIFCPQSQRSDAPWITAFQPAYEMVRLGIANSAIVFAFSIDEEGR